MTRASQDIDQPEKDVERENIGLLTTCHVVGSQFQWTACLFGVIKGADNK